jgi:hypothetical protein
MLGSINFEKFFKYEHCEQAHATHKRTERRAPMWESEFTTKAATLQGDSDEIVPSFFVTGLGPVVATFK